MTRQATLRGARMAGDREPRSACTSATSKGATDQFAEVVARWAGLRGSAGNRTQRRAGRQRPLGPGAAVEMFARFSFAQQQHEPDRDDLC
jgi:hypothetical protein